jgi:4-hydroxybenzoate polyprenyltransferase
MRALRTYVQDSFPLLIILYLALLGFLCVHAVQLYIGTQPRPAVGLIFMGIVFGIYIFNRFTDITEDFMNDIGKYVFFSRRTIIYKAGIAAVVLVLIALVALGKLAPYHLLLVSLGVLYSYRLLPWYSKRKGVFFLRLKELPLVKNIIVSSMWGTAVFAIPILFTGFGASNHPQIYVLVMVVAVSTMNNTVFCDIRDVAGDRVARNKTLPVLWGVRRTYVMMAAVNAAWLTAAAGMLMLRVYDVKHFAFILAMAAYPAAYVSLYHWGRCSKGILEFLCESDLLVFASGLALLSAVSAG